MNCKEASRLISRAADTPLGMRERWGLRLHLLICAACRRFAAQLEWIRRALRLARDQVENDPQIRLSHEARSRIAAAVQQSEQH